MSQSSDASSNFADAAKTTGRNSGGNAKRKLIEATIASLMSEGVDGCSVRKICDQANLSIGLVNYHFDSFNHLIAAAYTQIAFQFLQQAQSACEGKSDLPSEQLKAFIHKIFDKNVMRHDVLRAWIVFWGLIDSSSAVQRAHQESNAAFSSFLQSLFESLETQTPLSVSPRLAAIGLTALIDGLWLEWCLDSSGFSPQECILLCDQWIASVQS